MLDQGGPLRPGPPDEVARDPKVIEVYLGSGPAAEADVLAVEGLVSGYGRIRVLHGIDLMVDRGELVALIGPNGAGKTTLLRDALRGAAAGERPDHARGSADPYAPGSSPRRLGARAGARRPPGFLPLSVEDNLRLGAFARGAAASDLARILAMFPELAERRRDAAGGLSGGQQQMLALGRALMARPQLLLLDEPSLGLAPLLVERVMAAIRALHQDGVTILLVEQNAAAALDRRPRLRARERPRHPHRHRRRADPRPARPQGLSRRLENNFMALNFSLLRC